MACTYALQNNAALACHWLRRTLSLDKHYVKTSRNDPDFDAIRDSQEFQAVLKEIESAI
jgi:hypothetical protein